MAMLALRSLGLPQTHPTIQSSWAWMLELFDANGHGNWHDEPWETSWCVIAALNGDLAKTAPSSIESATAWLVGLQHSSGRVIAPHYTGYLVLIADLVARQSTACSALTTAAAKAADYLRTAISPTHLWTGEPWSNGQVLWALVSSGQFPCEIDEAELAAAWFLSHQDTNGSWLNDVEDTSSCLLGLYHLLRWAESSTLSNQSELSDLLYASLRRRLATPILVIRRPLVEHHSDGATSINLSKSIKKLLAVALAVISTASLLIAFWDQLTALFK